MAKAKYINPYTDFGFNKLFGEEASKELLKDFLNELLPREHKIDSLSFDNNEKQGTSPNERRAIFDIYCKSRKGDSFIVEMQKAKIKFFKDRAVFYTTFPIREQAEKGDWNFKLKPVYCVAILDFIYDDDREQKPFLSNVELKDQYCQTFYDKLKYIFIEMPRFTKKEEELENHFDKWLYFLKNLEDFEEIPVILREDVFIKGFDIARIANFDEQQMGDYEESLKKYRDLKGVVDTSYEEGKLDGKQEGKKERSLEIAKQMKNDGFPLETILKYTSLTKEEIEKL